MSSSSQIGESWISSFCNLLGHEYFAEVSEDFIEDDFNLTGLQSLVPMYKEALEMILDVEPDEEDEEDEEEEEDEDEDEILGDERSAGYRRASDRRHLRMPSDLSMIENSAELLYGLIHQRYITSRPGIQQMAEKYDMQHFGHCPRVFCNSAKVLPVGTSDTPGEATVKLFCPSCLDVYNPPNSRFQGVDGAFFGTTFGCLFFMTFPELDISTNPNHNFRSSLQSSGHPSEQQQQQAQGQLSLPTNSASVKSPSTRVPSSSSHPPPSQQLLSINGVAPSNLAPGLGDGNIYEPRIYGFRVSERARSGPRMRWLRSRPHDLTELDEATRFHELRHRGAAGDDDEDEEDEEEEEEEDVEEEDEEEEDELDEDEEEDDGEDATMPDAAGNQKAARRAVGGAGPGGGRGGGAGGGGGGRRQRRGNGVRGVGAGGSPMSTNGVGEGV